MGNYADLLNKIKKRQRVARDLGAKASTARWNSRRDSLSSAVQGSRTNNAKNLRISSQYYGNEANRLEKKAKNIGSAANRAERRARQGVRLLGASYELTDNDQLIEKSLAKKLARIKQKFTKGTAAHAIDRAKSMRKNELKEKDPKRIKNLTFGDRKFLSTNRNNHLKVGTKKGEQLYKNRSGRVYQGKDIDDHDDRRMFKKAKFTITGRNKNNALRFRALTDSFEMEDFIDYLLEDYDANQVRNFLENDFVPLMEGMIADASKGGEQKGLFAKNKHNDILTRRGRYLSGRRTSNDRATQLGFRAFPTYDKANEEIEMVNEAKKMKLKPGVKMKPKEFAKQKAKVLADIEAKKKAKSEKTKTPPVEKKVAVSADDESNRNSNILKGNYPWGKISPQLTKAVVSRLKQIEKPADRAVAMEKIWKSKNHLGALLSGNLSTQKEKEKTAKDKITLPKITGVNA